ncbi:MAG: methyltransferase [Clostridia bacterium]|nr:methyltransferase [Clostridia bacterium]
MTHDYINEGERLDYVNEDIRLIQSTKGLTFGTDAYMLAAFIRSEGKNSVAAELGSGTGIISLLCAAKDKLKKIYAIEIQESFARLCERNININGLSDKVTSVCADIREITPDRFERELDVVFANPPYMKVNAGKRNEHDEKFIARHEVCGNIYDFCGAASRLLRFGGLFYCVYRPDRMTELFAALREKGFEAKRMTLVSADSETPPSIMLVEAKKGASPGLKITPTLLLHKSGDNKSGKRASTEAAEKVYESCSFEHLGKG